VPQAGRQPTGRPPTTPAAVVRPRAPRRRSRREPLCVPETLKLILVALLVIALAVTIVFYVIP
jgi:hypothetical protein